MRQPFESLCSRLRTGSRVLLAGTSADVRMEFEHSLLRRMGMETETHSMGDRDLRLTVWPIGSFEAIHLHEAISGYRSEEVQRVVAGFFRALHPQGWLSFPYEKSVFSDEGFHSLLRQNGFRVHEEWETPLWKRVLAQRL